MDGWMDGWNHFSSFFFFILISDNKHDITFFMPIGARMVKFSSLTMLITVFFCDNFFFLSDFYISRKKKYYHKKKQLSLFNYFKKEIVISDL